MKHYGDVTKIKGSEVPMVDVITFGAPCQDISIAGKRAGMKHIALGDEETTRSGLFFEAIRIIKEMRDEHIRQLQLRGSDYDIRMVKPRFAVYENVPGAFSSNGGEDFRMVLEETAKIADSNASIPRLETGKDGKQKWSKAGAIMGDGWSIAWRVHDAQFWGVPQRRKRIALVADFGGATAPEILFERESLSGDNSESGKARESVATDVRSGITETIATQIEEFVSAVNKDAKHQQDLIQSDLGVARTLAPGTHASGSHLTKTLISSAISFQERAGKPGGGKGILIQNERTGALSTLNNQSVCAFEPGDASRVGGHVYNDDMAGTVRANAGDNQQAVVCLEGNGQRESHKGDGYKESDIMYTLNTVEHHAERGTGETSQCLNTCNVNNNYVLSMQSMGEYKETGVCSALKQRDYKDATDLIVYGLDRASFNQGKNAKYDFTIDEEKIGCQTAKGPGAVCQSIVRRLTPMECERLQGFPDHWTDIGDWVDSKGKLHKGDSDSPRYKALGNSIALPFWQWMAHRMVAVLQEDGVEQPTMASLFDGIGGFPLVFSRAGCDPLWASEIEEFPMAVTKKRFEENNDERN